MYEAMPDSYRQTLIKELSYQNSYKTALKTIVIVVHNQLDHVKRCIESVRQNTEDCLIYVWDNASDEETATYLGKAYSENLIDYLYESDVNKGFIIPNNRLVSLCETPYVILLNSDCIVHKNWDKSLIGFLQQNEQYGVVGYQGGRLDDDFIGCALAWGDDADYIAGWCMCFSMELYKKVGLFDEKNLIFAYGEDSDFCLRVKNENYKIYALHLDYVNHIGGVTIREVNKTNDTSAFFEENHRYLRRKYGANNG